MQTLYVTLAVGLMLVWGVLAVFEPRKLDVANALGILRYGLVARSLAIGVALTMLMITSFVVFNFIWSTPEKLNLAASSLLAFSVIAGLPLIEVTRVQIAVTEDGLTMSSPWTGVSVLKWIEVQRVRYSSINQWFTVESANRTIRVSRYLAGIGIFADALKRKVAAERWASVVRVVEKLI